VIGSSFILFLVFDVNSREQASVSPLLLIRHYEADGTALSFTRLLGLQLWFEIPIWNIKELFNCRNSSLVS
jgi:hypothetical protein